MTSSSTRGAITGINVTPLVDITLVLLVIFMVTAKLIVSPRAMNADLPHAESGEVVQNILSVALSTQGEVAIDRDVVADSDEILLGRFAAAAARDRSIRAIIEADAHVSHGRVMRVLDLLRRAGIARVGFGVVPRVAHDAR
jgi:biopolymer transport protein ExbD